MAFAFGPSGVGLSRCRLRVGGARCLDRVGAGSSRYIAGSCLSRPIRGTLATVRRRAEQKAAKARKRRVAPREHGGKLDDGTDEQADEREVAVLEVPLLGTLAEGTQRIPIQGEDLADRPRHQRNPAPQLLPLSDRHNPMHTLRRAQSNFADGLPFFLRNSNSGGPADIAFSYGAPGLIPVVGDWDANGTFTVGVVDSATGAWFLRNANEVGGADIVFGYGAPNQTPISGDWSALE
jgi:hypothetical protein